MGAATPKSKAGAKAGPSPWLASNPGKRWTEVFFLAYSPFWILWALCILVPLQLYEVIQRGRSQVAHWHANTKRDCSWWHTSGPLQHAGDWGYMLIGTSAAAPCVVLPLLLPGPKVRWTISSGLQPSTRGDSAALSSLSRGPVDTVRCRATRTSLCTSGTGSRSVIRHNGAPVVGAAEWYCTGMASSARLSRALPTTRRPTCGS